MGRPQFENQTSIAATTSKSIKYLVRESTVPLPSSTYERITIFSPPNTVSRIINCMMSFAGIPSQVAGNRQMIMDNYMNPTTGVGCFYAEAPAHYVSSFSFDQGHFQYGDDDAGTGILVYPTVANINASLRQTLFDDVIGVSFLFRHTAGFTTVDGTAKRKIILFTEEEVVHR